MEKIKTLRTQEGAELYIRRMGIEGATVQKCMDSEGGYNVMSAPIPETTHEYNNKVELRIEDYIKFEKFVSMLLEKDVIEVGYFGVIVSQGFQEKAKKILTEKAKAAMIQKGLEEFKITDLKLKSVIIIHENVQYKDPDFDKFFECVGDDEKLLDCLFDIGLLEMTDYGISPDYDFLAKISDCIKYKVMSDEYTVKAFNFDKLKKKDNDSDSDDEDDDDKDDKEKKDTGKKDTGDGKLTAAQEKLPDFIKNKIKGKKITKSIQDSAAIVTFPEENEIEITQNTLLKSFDSDDMYFYNSETQTLTDGWNEDVTLKSEDALMLEDADENKLIFTNEGIFVAEKAGE